VGSTLRAGAGSETHGTGRDNGGDLFLFKDIVSLTHLSNSGDDRCEPKMQQRITSRVHRGS
jgi:hypothetical protein